jgi:hypothetical protein
MIRFIGRHWITSLLLVYAGVYTLAALEYGIRVRPQPQSGFVPFLLGILIFGLTGFVLVRVFCTGEASEKEAEGENIPRKKFIIFLLLLLAGTACFEYLGFCFTSMAVIFLTAYLMGLRGWWKAFLLSVLATLVADILFAGLLGVPLPGILSSHLLGGN